MVKDMDHIGATYVFYVKVRTFDGLQQSKIYVLTIMSFGEEILTVPHDLRVSVYFV
jgi:hypothetical protein